MVRIFEVVVGGERLTVSIDGLDESQRVKMTREMISSPASDGLAEFLNDLWEPSTFPTPFADAYMEFIEWCKVYGKPVMSAKRMSMEMAAKFGKGRFVRHPATGMPVRGVMMKKKALPVAPSDPFAPAIQ